MDRNESRHIPNHWSLNAFLTIELQRNVFDEKLLTWHYHVKDWHRGTIMPEALPPHPSPRPLQHPCLFSRTSAVLPFFALAMSLPLRENCPARGKRDFPRTWSGTWVFVRLCITAGEPRERTLKTIGQLDSEETWSTASYLSTFFNEVVIRLPLLHLCMSMELQLNQRHYGHRSRTCMLAWSLFEPNKSSKQSSLSCTEMTDNGASEQT